MTSRTLLAGLLAVVFACPALAQKTDTPQSTDAKMKADKKMKPITGRFDIVSGMRDGKPIPAEHLDGTVAVFRKDKIVVFDKDENEMYASTYKLMEKKGMPGMVIMMTTVQAPDAIEDEAEGTKATGLIKREGKNLMLIYALPGGEAPKEFKAGAKQQMFVMKPAKKKMDADDDDSGEDN